MYLITQTHSAKVEPPRPAPLEPLRIIHARTTQKASGAELESAAGVRRKGLYDAVMARKVVRGPDLPPSLKVYGIRCFLCLVKSFRTQIESEGTGPDG